MNLLHFETDNKFGDLVTIFFLNSSALCLIPLPKTATSLLQLLSEI